MATKPRKQTDRICVRILFLARGSNPEQWLPPRWAKFEQNVIKAVKDVVARDGIYEGFPLDIEPDSWVFQTQVVDNLGRKVGP